MNNTSSQICKLLLADPDAVYPPETRESACLDKVQSDELNKIRQEVRQQCEHGHDEEAERLAHIAHQIIKNGSPSRDG